jgi:hypothetical protein
MVGLIPALVVVGSPLGEPLFAQFMKQFVQAGDERYASAEGRRTRRAAFDANVRKVRELNARDPHATYSAMVPWADLTEAELARRHGVGGGVGGASPRMVCQFSQDPPYAPPAALSPTATPKPSLDWVALGATVPVKNQGNCSSCWAHSAIAMVEGRLKIDTGNTTSLSEQFIMDCDKNRVLKGCGGGLSERVMQWLTEPGKQKVGIASAAQYPYVSASGVDPTKKQCHKSSPRVAQLTGFGTVSGDSQSMLAAATEFGVLSVCMDNHPLMFYKSGIITGPQCGTTSNHCVNIVGYGTENGQDYWKVRNSFGAQWGEVGYFRIERSSGNPAAPCGMSGCVLAATGANFTVSNSWVE